MNCLDEDEKSDDRGGRGNDVAEGILLTRFVLPNTVEDSAETSESLSPVIDVRSLELSLFGNNTFVPDGHADGLFCSWLIRSDTVEDTVDTTGLLSPIDALYITCANELIRCNEK